MPLVKMKFTAAGPMGCFQVGKTYNVTDEVYGRLIYVKACELVEEVKQDVEETKHPEVEAATEQETTESAIEETEKKPKKFSPRYHRK